MKKLTLILLLIGLFSGFAYASDEQQLMQATKQAEVKADDEIQEKGEGFISETALYYTFSTIAQTLAGAFGILGAFTMYRLQSIKESCSGIGKRIINANIGSAFSHLNDVYAAYTYQDWKVFHHILDKRKNDDVKFEEYKKAHSEGVPYSVEADCFYNCYNINKGEFLCSLEMLNKYLIIKSRLIIAIKSSLTLTVMTITLSLLILPFCGFLCSDNYLAIGITSITLALTIICLYLYASLIVKALGIGREK